MLSFGGCCFKECIYFFTQDRTRERSCDGVTGLQQGHVKLVGLLFVQLFLLVGLLCMLDKSACKITLQIGLLCM